MITVKMVRDSGCEISCGDVIFSNGTGGELSMNAAGLKFVNNGSLDNGSLDYFAWRKEEFPNNQDLIIEFRKNGTVGVDKIANVDYFSIDEWRPSMSNWADCEDKAEQKKIDWKNGDECICSELADYLNPCKYIAIDESSSSKLAVVKMATDQFESVVVESLSKPETPEEKEVRIRLEWIDSVCDEIGVSDDYIVGKMYDCGYRKQ